MKELLWPSATWLIMNLLFLFQFSSCVTNLQEVERIRMRMFCCIFQSIFQIDVASASSFFSGFAAHPSYDKCTISRLNKLAKFIRVHLKKIQFRKIHFWKIHFWKRSQEAVGSSFQKTYFLIGLGSWQLWQLRIKPLDSKLRKTEFAKKKFYSSEICPRACWVQLSSIIWLYIQYRCIVAKQPSHQNTTKLT